MILNDRVGPTPEKEEEINEGQVGFRPNRTWGDHMFTLGKVNERKRDAGPTTYYFSQTNRRCMSQYEEMGCRKNMRKTEIREKM